MDAPSPPTLRARLLLTLLLLAAGVSVVWRIDRLPHLPGINGDEAHGVFHVVAWQQDIETDWRTGSGLPLNPLFYGVAYLVHLVLPPSLLALRLTPLLFGLATLLLIYPLLRRPLGREAALISTVLAAILPLHIAYSRFAWDSSVTPLVTLLALAAALHRRPLLTLLAFGLAIWVHPMNLFLLPVLLAPFVERTLVSRRGRIAVAIVLPLLLAGGLLLLLHPPHDLAEKAPPDFSEQVRLRLTDPVRFHNFLRLYGDLLSGATVYRYLTGPISETSGNWHEIVFWLLAISLGSLGLRAFLLSHDRTSIALALGLGLSLLAFYLTTGSLGMTPHHERYATFLTLPSLVLASLALVGTGTLFSQPYFARQITILLASLLLIVFRVHYFGAMETSSPHAPPTFRTGPAEPKAAALEAIEVRRDHSRRTVVLTEDWWVYWTLRYLSATRVGYRITVPHEPNDFRFPTDARLPALDPRTDQLFAAGFAGGPLDRRFHGSGAALYTEEIYGHGPVPLLRVYEISPAAMGHESSTRDPASEPPNPRPPRKTRPR